MVRRAGARLSGELAPRQAGLEVRKGSRCRGRLSALARASRSREQPVSGAGPRRWRPEERAADYLQQPGLAAPPRPPPARPRRRTTGAPRAPGTRWREPGPSAPASGASSLHLQAGRPPPAPCGAGRPRASAAPARPPPPRCRGTAGLTAPAARPRGASGSWLWPPQGQRPEQPPPEPLEHPG